MICSQCGFENPQDTTFCPNCGAILISASDVATGTGSTTQQTVTTFTTQHSTSTGANTRLLKILTGIALGIQGLLILLAILCIGLLSYAISEIEFFDGATSLLGGVIGIILLFAAGSFGFTLLGVKRRSTVSLIVATIFACVATTFGTMIFESVGMRRFILLLMLMIYIAIIVVNHTEKK